jgi:bacillithiol system protein YtxJ
MASKFLKISEKETLENLLMDSRERPVIVFKHSNSCPISAAAYREMENVDGDVGLIDVLRARDVSREFAELTGVRHESPQVIILRDGRAVWNASHYDVKAGVVADAVQAHSQVTRK